jgi:hypothetical protein
MKRSMQDRAATGQLAALSDETQTRPAFPNSTPMHFAQSARWRRKDFSVKVAGGFTEGERF